MYRYMWDGSYTVEAAFIVPVVLGILYGWMFQLFYLHDQVVIYVKGKISASAVWKIPVMQQFLGNRFQSSTTQIISSVQPDTVLRIKGKEEIARGGD